MHWMHTTKRDQLLKYIVLRPWYSVAVRIVTTVAAWESAVLLVGKRVEAIFIIIPYREYIRA